MSDKPGIRLSIPDLLFLGAAGGVAAWLAPGSPLAASLLLMPVLHFFVFCNVLRVPIRYELTWSGLFLLNVTFLQTAGALQFPLLLYNQVPATCMVIVMTLRRRDYHGALWRRVNPGYRISTTDILSGDCFPG